MTNIVKYEGIVSKVPEAYREFVTSIIRTDDTKTIPVRMRDDDSLTQDVALLAKFIARDYQCKEPDQYQVTRFYQALRGYYRDLTIQEVKLAFTLGLIGVLDEYLPKGDANAYGEFSLKFITKILNAFKRKKHDVLQKVQKLLPEPVDLITEQEKKSNSTQFITDIKRWFREYRDEGVQPNIFVIDYVYTFLKGAGVVTHALDVTNEEVERQIHHPKRVKELRKDLRVLYKEILENDHVPDEIRRNANITARYQAILRGFDELINNNESIEDYL